jgi:enhancing lycopene biosynthesis protein 2
VRQISIDTTHRIITAPCYMMEASISDVHTNVAMAIDALMTMLAEHHG